jgi:hypothetical protein
MISLKHIKLRLLPGLLALIAIVPGLKAQEGSSSGTEKIQAQKVAFLTNRMGLTAEEAQKFWPVYNEYDAQRNQILEQRRSTSYYYTQNAGRLSEKETDAIIQKYISLQKQETDLLEKYNARFRQILPASKVMKLYVAEVEFRNFLLRQIRENKTLRNN